MQGFFGGERGTVRGKERVVIAWLEGGSSEAFTCICREGKGCTAGEGMESGEYIGQEMILIDLLQRMREVESEWIYSFVSWDYCLPLFYPSVCVKYSE